MNTPNNVSKKCDNFNAISILLDKKQIKTIKLTKAYGRHHKKSN